MAIEQKMLQPSRLDERRAAQIRAIYEASFPPIERVPFEHVLDSIAAGDEILLTLEEGEAVLGFAWFRRLAELNALYLEYIAVHPAIRSQGHGAMLLEEVIRLAKARQGNLGVVLEIESPEDATGEEKAARLRRVRFYRRHGGEVVEDHGAYLMPDFTGLGSMAMKIVWIPARPEYSGYPTRDLRGWIVGLYRAGYGRDETDPFLQQILRRLPGN
jgi:ribosomal protein S18 acetylase RimI-like enzyme